MSIFIAPFVIRKICYQHGVIQTVDVNH